jgi:hypothetical protein
MNNLEYQTECSITRYPFKDSSTLIWSNNGETGTLPNDIILDAQLTIPDGNLSDSHIIFLYKIETLENNIKIYFGDVEYSSAYEITISRTDAGIKTYSARKQPEIRLLRIDVNVDALNNYFTNLDYGTYLFSDSYDAANMLCKSCLRYLPPNITRIKIENTIPTGLSSTTTETVYDSITSPNTEISLAEGANTSFSISGRTNTINIARGLGAGLYDNCDNTSVYLKTINSVQPDLRGNIILNNDNCYSTRYGLQGLYLKNTCKPKCTSDEILDIAYYQNRVTDLANQLENYTYEFYGDGLHPYSTNTRGDPDTYMGFLNDYMTSEDQKMWAKNPYLMAHCNTLINKANQYHNITVGIYSPGSYIIRTTLYINGSFQEFQIVPGTIYITEKNVKTNIPDLNLNNSILLERNLTCSETIFTGLVLKQLPATPEGLHNNLGSSLYDMRFDSISYTDSFREGNLAPYEIVGRSGYILPLNPKSFNYTVAYTAYYEYIYPDPSSITSKYPIKYILEVDIGLYNSDATSGQVSLRVDTGGIGVVTQNKTIFNGETTNFAGIGFANKSIDFSKNNHYFLTIECPEFMDGLYIERSFDVKFEGTSDSGNATKTITIHTP